jgi:hypothetical protein
MHCTPRKQHSKINLYSILYLCTYIYLKGIVQPEKRGVESGTNRNVLTFAHNCRWFFFSCPSSLNCIKTVSALRVKKGGVFFDGSREYLMIYRGPGFLAVV